VLNYIYKHTAHFRNISKLLFVCIGAFQLSAQNTNDITFEDKSSKFGLRAATNGFGFYFRSTNPMKKMLSKAYDIDFSSIRHAKEQKVINVRLGNTRLL
jgi:hypothetical protein